jgi:hypothetical protein
MSPSHARKANGRRYRYYVSQAVLQGRLEALDPSVGSQLKRSNPWLSARFAKC